MLATTSASARTLPTTTTTMTMTAGCCGTNATKNDNASISRNQPRLILDEPFHPLYLQEGPNTSIVEPIVFEDGMDWEHCERLYIMLDSSNAERQRSLYGRNVGRTRRLSKDDVLRDASGKLRSCLRESKYNKISSNNDNDGHHQSHRTSTYGKDSKRKSFRRGVSFHTLPAAPTDDGSTTMLCEEPIKVGRSARVTFNKHASVDTIWTIDDYPEEVQDSLWFSRTELEDLAREALVAEAMEEREYEETRTIESDTALVTTPASASASVGNAPIAIRVC